MLRLPEYTYHRPARLEDALALLAEHGDAAVPIAGGTDLLPNMKHRLVAPAHLIALKQLPELRGIEVAHSELRIGAAETLTAVSRHPLVRQHAPSLARAAALVAGPQLRNMGTIGGNLCLDTRCTYYNQTYFWRQALGFCLKKDGTVCHVTKVGKKCVAAHSADTPPVLMTLGAVVDLASADGERSVAVEEFFVADGVRNTVRRPGELVTRIRVPLREPPLRASYQKLRQRNAVDFPLLSVAAAAEMEDDDVVRSLRVVVSALGARPRLLTGLERIVEGQRLTPDVIEAVAQRAFQQCHPLGNIAADAEWRRAMVPVYVRRALEELAGAAAVAA
ncbi:MAG: FAD binding domain-containing protein [bacterium]|jgi:4-hydroxybenzoyl-CoA reductase subunit beta|nr:MAG: 4-hydroxybenzoyl-CoA reductase [bacterium]